MSGAKPTIEALEKMMDEAEGKSIKILPNGELRVTDNECLSCSQLKAEVAALRQKDAIRIAGFTKHPHRPCGCPETMPTTCS